MAFRHRLAAAHRRCRVAPALRRVLGLPEPSAKLIWEASLVGLDLRAETAEMLKMLTVPNERCLFKVRCRAGAATMKQDNSPPS